MIQSCRLNNDLRVILEPVDHTGVVSIGFWQLYGARDEDDEQRGCSHFLEHMLFKGTKVRTSYQIAQQVERVGGYLNAFTEKELTCFYCTLPAGHINLAIDILSDMLTNSLLDPQEIEKEKLVIRNELNLIEDNADDKGHELYLKQMWNGHPLSRRITGESSQIKEITAAGLQDFYKERFGLSNMVITAAGKINSEVILSRLQKVLKRDRTCRFHTLRKPPERIRSWKIISGKFEQVHLFSGLCYALSGEIKEYFNELVFSTLFGESMSSRLFQRLREAEGLCYAVYTFRSYYSDTALWTIYANVVPESVSRLLDSLETELRRLLLEPPGRAEVGDAKSQLKGNFTLAKEDMENRMKRLLRQYVLTGQVLEHPESLSLLAAVSVEDVMSVIERLIKPENFNLLAYGNKKLKSLKKKKYCF